MPPVNDRGPHPSSLRAIRRVLLGANPPIEIGHDLGVRLGARPLIELGLRQDLVARLIQGLVKLVIDLTFLLSRGRSESQIVGVHEAEEITDRRIHLDAIGRYRDSTLHFVDCNLAAYSAAGNIALATCDTGFKKFSDVRVQI